MPMSDLESLRGDDKVEKQIATSQLNKDDEIKSISGFGIRNKLRNTFRDGYERITGQQTPRGSNLPRH